MGIQDVKPDDEIGTIMFSDREDLESSGRLRWKRTYDKRTAVSLILL